MSAREYRKSHDIDVFVHRTARNCFGRLKEPEVDHLHARISQQPGDDVDPAIVPVKADLGNEYSQTHRRGAWYLPKTSAIAETISPKVARALAACIKEGMRFASGSWATVRTLARAPTTESSSRESRTWRRRSVCSA